MAAVYAANVTDGGWSIHFLEGLFLTKMVTDRSGLPFGNLATARFD